MVPLPGSLFAKAIVGFAGASLASVTMASEVGGDIIPRWLLEGGSGVALVACLSYAVVNLWRANQALHALMRSTLEAQSKALAAELAEAQSSRVRLEKTLGEFVEEARRKR